LSSEIFEQTLYIGSRFFSSFGYFTVDANELGIMCEMFAESHIVKPEDQFESYVIGDVSRILMSIGNTAPYLYGTAASPQNNKKTCQGVGGHLGEGVTALIFTRDVGVPIDDFAHVGISSGPIIKCVDFVAITSLSTLYSYYRIIPYSWENLSDCFAFPIEAKSRKQGISARKCKGFLKEGVFNQIASYWWACRDQGLEGPAGYGIATAFSYQVNTISHCFLRPKSLYDRLDLIGFLDKITDEFSLRAVLEDENGQKELFSYLEAF
jgi:hypothetical protein